MLLSRRSAALAVAARPGGIMLRPQPFFSALRPVPTPVTPMAAALMRQPSSRAWETTVRVEEKEHGHIVVQPNESVLFFDNLFPLKLSSILTRPFTSDRDLTDLIKRFDNSSLGILDPIRLVKMAIPEDMPIKVTEILPRLKDGGAFVKFQHDPQLSPSEVEETLRRTLYEKPLKPWFNPFQRIKARLVRGTPWLEDLYRYPSSLVKVEFVPPQPGTSPVELPEETLYFLLRKFGKIADITPQAPDSKVSPRYALVGFPATRDAIMTRNCMHGFVVNEALGGGKDGTKLRMTYEKKIKSHSIWNWLASHPRIVVPAIAALLAGISVMVFDPMREFFVKLHIQHSLRFTDSKIYKWFKSKTDGFSFGRKSDKSEGLDSVWKHRRDLIDQLRGWLDSSSDTFIVVTGPKGSGKAEMVMDQALKDRNHVLMIDCKPIVEARGESGTISRLATAVGYRPVFSWANSMSSMIDLAVQSTTGVKAGFSETLEAQLNKILLITATSLKDVALSERSSRDSDANLSDDAFLEAHPERRPVVVIDNFLHKTEDKSIVYDKISEWAASVVQNNVAHIIFLTRDSGFSKPLTKALPDRVFRTLSLDDLDPGVARNFVLGRLEEYRKSDAKEGKSNETNDSEAEEGAVAAATAKPDLSELDKCISTLGGRLTDLEFFSRRLRTGQTPQQALEQIVDEKATDIVKIFLLGKTGEIEKKWSKQQAWHLVKALAHNPSLRYNQVLLSPAFASSTTPAAADGEAALENLSSAELISVKHHQGRPQAITAGRPVHRAAFSVLLRDGVLRAKMDLAVLDETAKVEAKSIESVENELSLLGSLPKQTSQTAGRVTYLLDKLKASHNKIAQLEKEMADLKKILNEQY